MHAPDDTTTASRSEQVTGPAHPPARKLVGVWGQGRRQITPWAYPHLRALAAVRLIVGIFLVGLGAVMLSHGDSGLAAVPLAGAALVLSIGYLDLAAARSAPPRA